MELPHCLPSCPPAHAPHPLTPPPPQGLERGECEAAGSVGVNLTLVHSWTRACLRAGMLAEEGRCKTLDSAAGAQQIRQQLLLLPNDECLALNT